MTGVAPFGPSAQTSHPFEKSKDPGEPDLACLGVCSGGLRPVVFSPGQRPSPDLDRSAPARLPGGVLRDGGFFCRPSRGLQHRGIPDKIGHRISDAVAASYLVSSSSRAWTRRPPETASCQFLAGSDRLGCSTWRFWRKRRKMMVTSTLTAFTRR